MGGTAQLHPLDISAQPTASPWLGDSNKLHYLYFKASSTRNSEFKSSTVENLFMFWVKNLWDSD